MALLVLSSETVLRLKELMLQNNEVDEVHDKEYHYFDPNGNLYCSHNCACMKSKLPTCITDLGKRVA